MKVNKVNGLNKKSFKNYTGPTDGFKSKNLFFGYNGQGKSALALGIIDEFLKDKENSENNYRLFNHQYVVNNLMLREDDDSIIKGVIANFGEKSIDVEKEINKLNEKIVDVEALKSEESKINSDISQEVDKIYNEKKGDIRINKILDADSIRILEKYYEELVKAKKIEPSVEKIANIDGSSNLQKRLEQLQQLKINAIEKINDESLDKIVKLLSKSYAIIDFPANKVLEWLKKGLEIHADGDDCKFCGGELDYQKMSQEVETYNNDERQHAINELKIYKEKVNRFNTQIEEITAGENLVISLLDSNLSVNYNLIKKNIKTIKKFEEFINNKIEDIALTEDCDIDKIKETMAKIVLNISEIQNIKNGEISKLENMINKQNTLIKGAIALDIAKNTFILEKTELLKSKRLEIENAVANNEECNSGIANLKQSQSNKSDFANHINGILKDFEINLELTLLDDNYIIKHTRGDIQLTINDISIGEKNLLAFLFFYYDLFDDENQKETKSEINLIIIDDPISSIDDNNRNFLLALIIDLFKKNTAQFFLFTHVWHDFYDLSLRIKDEATYFEVRKMSGNSEVCSVKKIELPYKHEFKEIYAFSLREDVNDLDECQIYHYPNVIRRILEEFLSFKVTKNNISFRNIDSITKALCNGEGTKKDKQNILTLINVCNSLSHKTSRNPNEILQMAKFLMRKIKEVDINHFSTNTN
jgi:D-Tyr-tRNAtyr deacylase